MLDHPSQLLKEMTSSAAFRCVQAWLLDNPAAWADDPCLAAAQMAQRPSNKRPREDALLEAERSHQRRRIELLDKQLDSTLVEARRLACKLENTEHSQEVLEEVCEICTGSRATSRGTGAGKIGRPEMTRARPSSPRTDVKVAHQWQAELSRDVE